MTGERIGRRIAWMIPPFVIRWWVRNSPAFARIAEDALAQVEAEEGPLTEDEKRTARATLGLHNDGDEGG